MALTADQMTMAYLKDPWGVTLSTTVAGPNAGGTTVAITQTGTYRLDVWGPGAWTAVVTWTGTPGNGRADAPRDTAYRHVHPVERDRHPLPPGSQRHDTLNRRDDDRDGHLTGPLSFRKAGSHRQKNRAGRGCAGGTDVFIFGPAWLEPDSSGVPRAPVDLLWNALWNTKRRT